jgi:DNA repair exonuclease SbcCD ATPase subunit
MKIKKLKLKNYKRFNELELDFDSGINIIVGDNEAGKSTISQAIMDLLYLDPTTKSQNTHARIKSWGQSNLPILDMIFSSDGDDYQFIKDFSSKSLILQNLSNKKKTENYKDSIHYIKTFTGIGNESIFRKTAFINQGDIAWADSSDDLLHEITSGTNEGSNSGAQQIIKNLKLRAF